MKEECDKGDVILASEAAAALQSLSRRLALIHLSYARTIIDELGEENGMRLISKAIKDYGSRIGEKTRKEVLEKGLEATPENFGQGDSYALPKFRGLHERLEAGEVEGRIRIKALGCMLAEVWKEYGEERLGRLYCYMDPAKYMAYNKDYKLVHTKTVPDGDECCEFEVKRTTEREKADFFSEDRDWFYIDK
jgi:hypothetical protein